MLVVTRWYGHVMYYPWGFRRKPKVIRYFTIVDPEDNLLEQGKSLATVFRPLEIPGFPQARMILRVNRLPGKKYRTAIKAYRTWGKIILIRPPEVSVVDERGDPTWDKALISLLGIKPRDHKKPLRKNQKKKK